MFEDKTPKERYMIVNDFLHNHETAVITFTKKDGTIRELFGTTNSHFLPERALDEHHRTKLVDWETFTIWDLEADGWRAFKTANLIKIEGVEDDSV